MQTRLTRRFGAALGLVLLAGCTRSPPGVLTLAPAGMRTTGMSIPHPDGTLSMSVGAIANSVVYVEAGAVTVTVTAKAPAVEHPSSIELWFEGQSVGTAQVQATTPQPFRFHSQARRSGAKAIRVAVQQALNADPAQPGPVLDLEKVVITQP